MKQSIGFFAALAALFSSKRKASPEVKIAPTTQQKFGPGPTMFSSTPYGGRRLNQRQYRKMCRQNPSLYGSKKHRSKN